MTYTVIHRDKNGHAISDIFDAESRSALFTILKERGITAIRVTEGAVKSSPKTSFNTKKCALIAAAILLLSGICCFLFLYDNNPPPVVKKATSVKQTKTVKQETVVIKKPTPKPTEKPKRFWEVDASQTNGFTEMQMRKWRFANRPAPSYTNNAVKIRKKPVYAIFKHGCENLIAAYITMPPGEGMIGTPMLGDRFKQDFLKSLKDEIIINDDDTTEVKRLKQDMIATKADLKARIDAGEDIGEIIKNTHDEFQSLARYKQMLQKEIAKVKKDSTMTLEDVETFVEAANQMLESKGIAPIKLGPISKRMIQRRQGL